VHEVGRPDHASTEQLSALLDDRAEVDEQRFLAGHLDRCVVCASELADLRSVRTLLRALPVHLPPRAFTIPVAPARAARRFRRLVALTRVLSAAAAILCVVLFSVDAMTKAYNVSSPMHDAPAALLIPRSATDGAAAKTAARSAAESAAKPADADRATESKPAAPAPAAQPAAQPQAPAATPQSQPAVASGAAAPAARPNEPTTTSPASSRSAYPAAAEAASSAATRQPGTDAAAPAAAQAPAQPPAQAGPPPPQATVAAFGPTQSAFAPGIQPTLAAPVVTGAAPQPQVGIGPATAVPPTVRQPTQTSGSLWLTPIRLWIVGLAVAAAGLLIASLVFSRFDRLRTGASDTRR
jgi:hypothetical protein